MQQVLIMKNLTKLTEVVEIRSLSNILGGSKRRSTIKRVKLHRMLPWTRKQSEDALVTVRQSGERLQPLPTRPRVERGNPAID